MLSLAVIDDTYHVLFLLKRDAIFLVLLWVWYLSLKRKKNSTAQFY